MQSLNDQASPHFTAYIVDKLAGLGG